MSQASDVHRSRTSVGAPALVLLLCTSLAWLINGENGWDRPSQGDVTLYALMACTPLALFAALPLPVRQVGRGRWGRFGFVWALLIAVGFYGVPNVVLPALVLKALIVLGLGLSLAAYVRAWLGRDTQLSIPAVSLFNRLRLPELPAVRGWSVVLADVARSSALLSLIAIVGTSLTRWLYPVFNGPTPLTWLFVSAIAVGSSLLMRRWINAVLSFRMLPIGDHRLTFILNALLMAPGVIACLLTIAVWHVWPGLGLDLPPYLLLIFLIAPVGLMSWQQRRQVAAAGPNTLRELGPLMQQIAWPIWLGSLSTFPRLPSGAVLPVLAVLTVGFGVFGYYALLAGVRSTDGFEHIAGAS